MAEKRQASNLFTLGFTKKRKLDDSAIESHEVEKEISIATFPEPQSEFQTQASNNIKDLVEGEDKSNKDVLSKKAADELGLPQGIHVGSPLIDAYAGALCGLACKSPISDAHLSERLVIVAGYKEKLKIFLF